MKAIEVLENGIKISHRHRCGPQGRCLLKAKQIPIFLILAKNTEIKSHLDFSIVLRLRVYWKNYCKTSPRPIHKLKHCELSLRSFNFFLVLNKKYFVERISQ